MMLQALDPVRQRFGAELVVITGMSSSSVAHVLARLEGAGLVASTWEDRAEADFGREDGLSRNRGRRRYWWLTDAGVSVRAVWLAEDAAAARGRPRGGGGVVPGGPRRGA
jgi:DNA-binding PadR family transcriptional regulator